MSQTANGHDKAIFCNDRSLIRLGYYLRFEPEPSQPGNGSCLVEVMCEIAGETPASFPFVAITALGLDAKPALGWTQSTIVSVRRMLRFAPDPNHLLEPGNASHCCTIRLRYNCMTVRRVEFERGTEHVLSRLPDLNVMHVVGAGNYPPERVKLRVPATEILALIDREDKLNSFQTIALSDSVELYSPDSFSLSI